MEISNALVYSTALPIVTRVLPLTVQLAQYRRLPSSDPAVPVQHPSQIMAGVVTCLPILWPHVIGERLRLLVVVRAVGI